MTTIETFENPERDRDYTIRHEVLEFTSVCPKTGQPDFAEMTISYSPAERCVELKSLKLYLQSYRDQGIFYEAVTNKILDDLVAACEPVWMELESRWSTRGGLRSVINVEFFRPDEDED